MNEWLDICRKLYNYFLQQRKELYEETSSVISCYNQMKQLPKMKEEDKSLCKIYAQVLQETLKRLDLSFKEFFRRVKNGERKKGYPRFKSRNRYNSFTYPQYGFKIMNNKLHLSKIGKLKIRIDRTIPKNFTIKTCSIKRDLDHWYVTFVVVLPQEKPQPFQMNEIKNSVGIDVGLEKLLATSDGEFVNNPRWFQTSHKKLSREQRNLARKKKGSKNREKQKLKVARLHRKIRNQRKDFLHKVSTELVEKNDLIVFEDLKIRNMVKNKHLSKSISDAGWRQLITYTHYKAESAGKRVVVVDPKNTSQTCTQCKKLVKKSLAVRTHSCPHCGLVLDRDVNAAKNILERGWEKLRSSIDDTAGLAGSACGEVSIETL